jgi:hypothetical protein
MLKQSDIPISNRWPRPRIFPQIRVPRCWPRATNGKCSLNPFLPNRPTRLPSFCLSCLLRCMSPLLGTERRSFGSALQPLTEVLRTYRVPVE